jgi:Flp pilus assembly protein TadG
MPGVVAHGASRRGTRARPAERGQAAVEAAVVLPLLLLVAIGLVQFALFVHAQGVVTGAVQDGARVAAAEGRTPADGVAHAEALLRAGLGRYADDVTVRGSGDGQTVALEARGRLRTIVPWVADATLPLGARAIVGRERFRGGPGR